MGNYCLIITEFLYEGNKNVLKIDTGDGCITLNVINATQFYM